jgi:hypothetical protein
MVSQDFQSECVRENVRVSMNQQYRISEHEIIYYDNSKVQLFCYYMPTTKHNTWQHQRVKLPNSNTPPQVTAEVLSD